MAETTNQTQNEQELSQDQQLALVTALSQLQLEERRGIDPLELLFTLLNNWKALLLGILMGAVMLGAYQTFMIVPTYRASAEIYIPSNDSLISIQDLQIGTAIADDIQYILTSRQVLKRVINNLNLETNYKTLKNMVAVDNPTGTHVISISVTTTDLELSRDIANEVMTVGIDQIYQVVGSNEPTVIDFSEAEAVEIVTPSFKKYVVLGGGAGFVLVAGVLILQMMLNNTLKTDDDVQKYMQLPVLAAVPFYED